MNFKLGLRTLPSATMHSQCSSMHLQGLRGTPLLAAAQRSMGVCHSRPCITRTCWCDSHQAVHRQCFDDFRGGGRSLDGSQVRRFHEHSEGLYHIRPCIVSYCGAIAEMAKGHLKDCYFDSFVKMRYRGVKGRLKDTFLAPQRHSVGLCHSRRCIAVAC